MPRPRCRSRRGRHWFGRYREDIVESYIQDVNSGDSQSVTVGTGGVGTLTLSALDGSSITANSGGVGIAVGAGAANGVGVTVGISAASDTVSNTVEAFIDSSLVTVNGSSVSLLASESATIAALTIGGAIAVGGGGGGAGVGVGAAGAGSGNTITNTVEAYIQNNSTVNVPVGTGGISLTATDAANITANGGGVGIAVGGGGSGGVAVSLGVSYANNEVEDHVETFVTASTVMANGPVNLATSENTTIVGLTLGGAVSLGVGGEVGIAAGIAGSSTINTVENTVDAFVSGNSHVTAQGGISISAADNTNVTAGGGGVGLAIGGSAGVAVAAAVGYATVMDTIENQVNAYVDGSTLTSTSGTVSITATETAIVTASALGGSASVSGASGPAVAAAGAGASVSNTLANTVLAYANNATIKTLTSGDVMLEVQDSTTGIAKAAAASLSGSFSPVAAVRCQSAWGWLRTASRRPTRLIRLVQRSTPPAA